MKTLKKKFLLIMLFMFALTSCQMDKYYSRIRIKHEPVKTNAEKDGLINKSTIDDPIQTIAIDDNVKINQRLIFELPNLEPAQEQTKTDTTKKKLKFWQKYFVDTRHVKKTRKKIDKNSVAYLKKRAKESEIILLLWVFFLIVCIVVIILLMVYLHAEELILLILLFPIWLIVFLILLASWITAQDKLRKAKAFVKGKGPGY